MMGVSGFFITFAFPAQRIISPNRPFMLPWLSIGNFTNLPTYDFGQLLVGSFTLLFGISIISLVHYALFCPIRSPVSQRQKAFFRSSEALLLICGPANSGAAPVPSEDVFRLHRTRFWLEIGIWQKNSP